MGIILAPIMLLLLGLVFPALYLLYRGFGAAQSKIIALVTVLLVYPLVFSISFFPPFLLNAGGSISWTFVFGMFVVGGGGLCFFGVLFWVLGHSKEKPYLAILAACFFLAGASFPIAWFALTDPLTEALSIGFRY